MTGEASTQELSCVRCEKTKFRPGPTPRLIECAMCEFWQTREAAASPSHDMRRTKARVNKYELAKAKASNQAAAAFARAHMG